MEVYARAARVELFVNGKSVGAKKLKNDCVARFKCAYQDGTVDAVSYNASGKEIGRSTLRTASQNTDLRAVPEETSVKPGHLAYIRLQYTDETVS